MADIRDTAGHAHVGGVGSSVLSWLHGPHGWPAVLASGLVVATAASAAVVLHRADPASADTRVAVARLAQVYLPDGSNHAAVEGEVLPRGAELHTGDGGGAQLTTAGRRVYLGGLSTLRVQDGVRETLSRGQAMVDARDGAHLELTTPAGEVAVPAGAVARVEEALLTRVAVYDGTVALHPVGRASSTAVPAFHQVKIQPQSLPQRTTPLQLRGDSWERAVAADLVSADEDLNSLAAGLALQEGASYLATVPASFRSGAVPAPGAQRGEEALTALVAAAAEAPDALATVRADRADLGSWGVVAAIVRARVAKVSQLLSAALAPGGNAGGPTIVNAAPPPGGLGVLPTGTASPNPGRSTHPTATPTTPPPPPPTPGLVDRLVTAVVTLVSPKPTSAPVPAQTPVAATNPCLLGAVLC
ncbi:MAG: hypothetical protein ABR549_05630 [Mycobacteriales bacterium]